MKKNLKRAFVILSGLATGLFGYLQGHSDLAMAGVALAGWAVPWISDYRVRALLSVLFKSSGTGETASHRIVPIEEAPSLTGRERDALRRLRRISNSPPAVNPLKPRE